MPCLPMSGGGFICTRNEPVEIKHENRTYRFEWTASSGWMPVNKNGQFRRSPIPLSVWDKLAEEYK